MCPPGQEWKQCVTGAASCTDVTLDLSRNCTPGCQCPRGTVQQVGGTTLKTRCERRHTHVDGDGGRVVNGPYFQDGVCVLESDCRCDVNGEQYQPGDGVFTDCRNW